MEIYGDLKLPGLVMARMMKIMKVMKMMKGREKKRGGCYLYMKVQHRAYPKLLE